jgi:hypothetical protein
METPGSRVFFFLVFATLCGALWWHFATRERHAPSDFITIDAAMEDYHEHITSLRGAKSGQLDLSIAGRREPFAVANNDYLKNFHREAFFKSVPKGSMVRLTVAKENLDHPGTDGVSAGPTVWVWGLESEGQIFYALEDALNWEAANRRNGLIIASIFTVVLLCCLWVWIDGRMARARQRRMVIS